jgi:hypothetical protein
VRLLGVSVHNFCSEADEDRLPFEHSEDAEDGGHGDE